MQWAILALMQWAGGQPPRPMADLGDGKAAMQHQKWRREGAADASTPSLQVGPFAGLADEMGRAVYHGERSFQPTDDPHHLLQPQHVRVAEERRPSTYQQHDVEALKRTFAEDGLVVVDELLPPGTAARLSEFCTHMLERQHGAAALTAEGYTRLGVGIFDTLAEEDWDIFMPLYRHPVIHELARSALGRGYQLGVRCPPPPATTPFPPGSNSFLGHRAGWDGRAVPARDRPGPL